MRLRPVVVVIVVGVASVVVPALPARPAPGLKVAEAVTRYAPVVYLHKDEEWRPMSAATFVRGSTLRWHHDSGCDDHEVEARPDPGRLARGEYQHQTTSGDRFAGGCDHQDPPYLSNEDVRPRDGDNAPGGEGMFLDLADSLRSGEGTGSPMYYDVRGPQGGRAINYWFLYGNSRPNIQHAPDFSHEGDWEHITVFLDGDNRARRVYYAQHHGGCFRPLNPQDRPVVYSARGGHASYPEPGDYTVDGPGPWNLKDEARHDTAWDAQNRLIALLKEPWYGTGVYDGFGGGWGQVGNSSDLTGPQGPHRRWKTGLPTGNPPVCSGPDS